MTAYDYRKIASIVGEDKIDALREAGVQIGEKPTKPTMGLFGRWAKHPGYGDVLITVDKPAGDGFVWFAFREDGKRGQLTSKSHIARLTFPEETIRPEDVPVGEAWLVNIDDGDTRAYGVVALKTEDDGNWCTRELNDYCTWYDDEITLVSPLVPARPTEPVTVTTEEEYAALPAGSIVSDTNMQPWMKTSTGGLTQGAYIRTVTDLAGTPRRVLRRGWGE